MPDEFKDFVQCIKICALLTNISALGAFGGDGGNAKSDCMKSGRKIYKQKHKNLRTSAFICSSIYIKDIKH